MMPPPLRLPRALPLCRLRHASSSSSSSASAAATSFSVDADIARARTPPGSFYAPSAAAFAEQRERVFARSWQLVPRLSALGAHGDALPFSLLRGALDEPLLAVRDGAATRVLSNACSHRGKELLAGEGLRSLAEAGVIRCGYHGRRFGLDGRCLGAPGFARAEPAADDLPAAELHQWRGLPFVRLPPPVMTQAHAPAQAQSFEAHFGDLLARLAPLPVERLEADASGTRSFTVRCHWALYVENYLEGLHVPFVHPSLSRALDMSQYRTELFSWGSLQVGPARSEDAADALLPLPPLAGAGAGAAGAGRERVAALYAWLWPNTMVNFYSWGLSANVVVPEAPDRTRIDYARYLWPREAIAAARGDVGGSGGGRSGMVKKGVTSRFRRCQRRRAFLPTHLRHLQS